MYANSKLFNVMFSVGLNNLFQAKNLKNMKTASLHPGSVESTMGDDMCFIRCLKCCCCCLFVDGSTGARTSVYLSTAPFEEIKSG